MQRKILHMKIGKILIQTIIALFISIIAFLSWISFSDFKPDKKIIVEKNNAPTLKKDTLSILIWNIGYAGLGADMDFFYDGGERMQTSETIAKKNFTSILNFLNQEKENDFILLQEVDINSKRSYEINQKNIIEKTLNDFSWYFTYNYKVGFVPFPLGDPLGKVNSGLLCGSKNKPSIITRYQYEGNYAWPKSLFMLDRCYTVMSYKTENQDTLFIVNTHNTAYDDGNLRANQMKQIREWMIKKYINGNYVIIGGDWNQVPTDISINHFGSEPQSKNYIPKYIPKNFLPKDWKIIYDRDNPTNRGLNTSLSDKSHTTIIDYFILSPNLKAINVETINLKFKNSDHNPVKIIFTIN
jgi:endonuclease/exonuclease/phosphatase family metal-dependent hydrolase